MERFAFDPNKNDWCDSTPTPQLLGQLPDANGSREIFIPKESVRVCLRRLHVLRNELRRNFIGLFHSELGERLDWLLACAIARENPLLLGSPGVAKTQIAMRLLELLGLQPASIREDILKRPMPEDNPYKWWQQRERDERAQPKYFHYLLSRFTQPEELFGPIEIRLLRQGMLVRINFALLTGAGVYGAFLDEIFKATSAILNTLLTLSQERRYFNWGAMVPADLLLLIGASNEMPGGLGSGAVGIGSGGEDFQTLYAFVDRFPVRLDIPQVSGKIPEQEPPETSNLGRAFDEAIRRESSAFVTGSYFKPRTADMPCLNDVLCVGRTMLQHRHIGVPETERLFERQEEEKFSRAFVRIATTLQQHATALEAGQLTWTISPRKLKSLYKIALAHALVCDDHFATGHQFVALRQSDLRVFYLIWDAPAARDELAIATRAAISRFCSELGVNA